MKGLARQEKEKISTFSMPNGQGILKFLALQHLPAILPLKPAADPDVKKYCESLACDAMKMVMTAARKTIVAADGGQLWAEAVNAVIPLARSSGAQ